MGPPVMPDDPFQPAPDDPKRLADEKAEKEKVERRTADHEKKLADGKKRVDELSERFASWYYVTPGTSFRSIALDRSALMKSKQDKPAGGPADMPGVPGLQGMPNLNFPHP
jgi:hypothetical protein